MTDFNAKKSREPWARKKYARVFHQPVKDGNEVETIDQIAA
ncbi:hypothetical protein ACH518_17725 [Methylomonas sp. HW2-6]